MAPGPQPEQTLGVRSRLEQHRELAAELQSLSDREVLAMVVGATDQRVPITLPRARQSATVFVKLVPLSDEELRLQHERPTGNLFGLPPHYHYRLGSYGSGAWREIAAHEQANRWVRSGRCPQFPLLHHLRVLPVSGGQRIDSPGSPWRDYREVQDRVAAVERSSHSVALFLEYFPATLTQVIEDTLDAKAPATAIAKMERQLLDTLDFLHAEGFVHLDAHPANVLTNGEQLFLTDFGLSLSQSFDLDSRERRFVADHADYDRCVAITGIVSAIVRHYAPVGDWRAHMQNMIAGRGSPVADDIVGFLARRASLAAAMGNVYAQLQKDPAAVFPPSHFAALLRDTEPFAA
jgi:serine/threonine protein kinase